MTNQSKITNVMHSPVATSVLLGIIVAMMGWYLPDLSNKVDESHKMEEKKLEQIYEIKFSFNDLNNSVANIERKVDDSKKKTEYILKSVNDRFDIVSSDIKLLCSEFKRYSNSVDWASHPECKSK